MHEFIRAHRQRPSEAFGLSLSYAPSCAGLRGIPKGVDASALEATFRAHGASLAPRPESEATQKWGAIAVNGKTLRGSFGAFAERKAANMLSALRQCDQIVLGHMMSRKRATKSRRLPS